MDRESSRRHGRSMVAVRQKARRALGQAIQELRIAKDWSQEELALQADVDRSYMGRLERGERNPSYEVLLQIADTLGVRGSELLAAAERFQR